MADDNTKLLDPPAEYSSSAETGEVVDNGSAPAAVEEFEEVAPDSDTAPAEQEQVTEAVTETETSLQEDPEVKGEEEVQEAAPETPVIEAYGDDTQEVNHQDEQDEQDEATPDPAPEEAPAPEPYELPPPPPEDEEPEPEDVSDDRPVIELFVKAAVDKMKNGGCPTCHRYFLVFYVLRERGLIDLVVTTFLPENPPKEVLDISNGKHYPLIKVHRGLDARSQDVSGIECDTVDEIELLLERFDCGDMQSSKESKAEGRAEKSFEDLYQKFMVFMKDSKNNSAQLVRCLEKVDAHLRDIGMTFMINERLARADCYILPSLQHIRVAGKAYKTFEIPTELTFVWRYLKNSYEMDAFRESCPADREIITHYEDKASSRPRLPVRRSQLMDESRTFSIPSEVTNGL